MKSGKFWLAVLVAGVVANILDSVVYGMWLGPTYFAPNPSLFRQDMNVPWYVVGDFIKVFVFGWVYARIAGSFGYTPKAGATIGLYLGVLMNFPTWIFVHLMFNGYPYALSWINIAYGIIWCVVVGAVIGAIYRKE